MWTVSVRMGYTWLTESNRFCQSPDSKIICWDYLERNAWKDLAALLIRVDSNVFLLPEIESAKCCYSLELRRCSHWLPTTWVCWESVETEDVISTFIARTNCRAESRWHGHNDFYSPCDGTFHCPATKVWHLIFRSLQCRIGEANHNLLLMPNVDFRIKFGVRSAIMESSLSRPYGAAFLCLRHFAVATYTNFGLATWSTFSTANYLFLAEVSRASVAPQHTRISRNRSERLVIDFQRIDAVSRRLNGFTGWNCEGKMTERGI